MNHFQLFLERFECDSFEKVLNKAKILVIDDNVSIQKGLKKILTNQNYEVLIAGTGRKGLELLESDVDLVILDIKLPEMEGYEIYEKLKQKRPDLPILFYSAHTGTDEIVRRCLSLNPLGFIEKGIEHDFKDLYAIIERAVSGDR